MMPNLDNVIEILQKEGVSDEGIRTFIENLTKAIAQNMYTTIIAGLNEEDLQRLNAIVDEKEREKETKETFEKNTGQNLQRLSDQFVQTYVSEFVANYKSVKNQSAS